MNVPRPISFAPSAQPARRRAVVRRRGSGAIRGCVLAALLAAASQNSGCGSAYRYEPNPPHVHPACGEQRADHAIVRLLFATDRSVTGGQDAIALFGLDRSQDLRLGGCDVTIPREHGCGRLETPILRPPRPDRDVALTGVRNLQRAEFLAALRTRVAQSPSRQVFVFIHGFANTFESAARRAAQIAHDLSLEGVPIVYSWPTQGSLLSYLVDAENAEWSAVHLSEFLDLLAHESGAQRIHLMAHSMGTQVLARGMREYAAEYRRGDRPEFDQIVLAASDMDTEIFQRDYLRHLVRCSRRVTIYVSGADWALGGSHRLHKYARLGQLCDQSTGVDAPSRVEIIDATDCDRGLIGHIYYGESPTILADLRRVLAGDSISDRGLSAGTPHHIRLNQHLLPPAEAQGTHLAK